METPEQNQICKKADTNKNAETTTDQICKNSSDSWLDFSQDWTPLPMSAPKAAATTCVESSNGRESRQPTLDNKPSLRKLKFLEVIPASEVLITTGRSTVMEYGLQSPNMRPRILVVEKTRFFFSSNDMINEDDVFYTAFGSPPQQSETIRSPCFRTMEARLASFKNFPSGNSIPHQQLAEAGLYFTGQGDLCRCFSCGGALKDWSFGDDPVKEHARYFPYCSFINRSKGREHVQFLQEVGLENEHICGGKDVIGGYYTSSQRSDRTGNITERKGDLCQCFSCGGFLKAWGSGDDPIKEHARMYPNCSFIDILKRRQHVQFLQEVALENEHICGGKDDIGGYYTSSQRSDRTGNISGREDICCFVNGGCIKGGRLCDKTIGEQDTYFSRDTYRNKSKRYTTRQRDVIKNASTSERNQHSASQTTQGNGYSFEYTSVLRKSTKHVVLHMDPRLVLDEFTTCGFLTNIEIRDIEELQLTSEKNRAILRKVMTKGVNGYNKFKSALKESNQTHLLDLLLREELS